MLYKIKTQTKHLKKDIRDENRVREYYLIQFSNFFWYSFFIKLLYRLKIMFCKTVIVSMNNFLRKAKALTTHFPLRQYAGFRRSHNVPEGNQPVSPMAAVSSPDRGSRQCTTHTSSVRSI